MPRPLDHSFDVCQLCGKPILSAQRYFRDCRNENVYGTEPDRWVHIQCVMEEGNKKEEVVLIQ